MEVDAAPANVIVRRSYTKPLSQFSITLPETEVYFRILILHYLLSSSTSYDKTIKLAHESVDKIRTWNRRTLDPLAARVWFAIGRAYELGGELADIRP